MQGIFLLFIGQSFEIDTGKFRSPFRIFQQNLSVILEVFHLRIYRQAQHGLHFQFVNRGIVQADMFLHDTALRVDHK